MRGHKWNTLRPSSRPGELAVTVDVRNYGICDSIHVHGIEYLRMVASKKQNVDNTGFFAWDGNLFGKSSNFFFFKEIGACSEIDSGSLLIRRRVL